MGWANRLELFRRCIVVVSSLQSTYENRQLFGCEKVTVTTIYHLDYNCNNT